MKNGTKKAHSFFYLIIIFFLNKNFFFFFLSTTTLYIIWRLTFLTVKKKMAKKFYFNQIIINLKTKRWQNRTIICWLSGSATENRNINKIFFWIKISTHDQQIFFSSQPVFVLCLCFCNLVWFILCLKAFLNCFGRSIMHRTVCALTLFHKKHYQISEAPILLLLLLSNIKQLH